VSELKLARQRLEQMVKDEIAGKAEDVYAKDYVPKKMDKKAEGYGTPKPGSLSEARGKEASKNVAREMLQLCEILLQFGKNEANSGKIAITFGELFNIYTYISDKASYFHLILLINPFTGGWHSSPLSKTQIYRFRG
jgi:hypothetical protein